MHSPHRILHTLALYLYHSKTIWMILNDQLIGGFNLKKHHLGKWNFYQRWLIRHLFCHYFLCCCSCKMHNICVLSPFLHDSKYLVCPYYFGFFMLLFGFLHVEVNFFVVVSFSRIHPHVSAFHSFLFFNFCLPKCIHLTIPSKNQFIKNPFIKNPWILFVRNILFLCYKWPDQNINRWNPPRFFSILPKPFFGKTDQNSNK